MKVTINLPYVEYVGKFLQRGISAPKRHADAMVSRAMVSALEQVTMKMRAELETKEQA